MSRSGFTLTELLLSIGIIGILSSIVIVAINPARQLAQARNAARRSDVRSILDAIHQHAIANGGIVVAGIDDTWRMLGTDAAGCAVACAGLTGGGGEPTDIILSPVADAPIWQAAPMTTYGDPQLWSYPWTPSSSRRALIRFDLSGLADATINTAALFLHEATTYGQTRTVGLYRLTRNWVEGNVTWNLADTPVPWTTPGGDYAPTPAATASVVWTGSLDWNSWNVQSDVAAFAAGSASNFGWLLRDVTEDGSQAYWFFDSREAANPANRPYLSINYTPGSGGSGLADSCLNLSGILGGVYLPSVPEDSLDGSEAQTKYAVHLDDAGAVSVRACRAELGEDIVVTR